MARKYSSLAATPVPQSEALDERQIPNNAGGFVYQLDDFARLSRFLILGSDSATYYQKPEKLTRENAACVTRCYDTDPVRTVETIATISDSGRAPKNDSAIFALALGAAHKDAKVRTLALTALPRVCRIGTHLFQLADNLHSLGKGWGRAQKRAFAKWYNDRPVDSVAYQAIKYREREGYSHKRILKTAHPSAAVLSTKDGESVSLEDAANMIAERTALYRWIRGVPVDGPLPKIVEAHIEAMKTALPVVHAETTTEAERNVAEKTAKAENEKKLLQLITENRLPWEAIPTEASTDKDVWAAMLPDMGLTALVRNLGNMTRYGTIAPMNEAEKLIVEHLGNETELKKARVHPFSILLAAATYGSGRGFRGSGTWDPSQPIMGALNDAFYKAFANVVPTGKRRLVALDVSGSMTSPLMGSPLTVRAGSSAMALITLATEKQTHIVGFTSGLRGGSGRYWGSRERQDVDGITPLKITSKMSVEQVCAYTDGLDFGSTDCALPMLYAAAKGIEVDCFEIYTDAETWAGSIHPMEALRAYRKKTGINAKLVVIGMTATSFTIADPADGGALDVCGFDSNAPALIADFIRS
ncbi:MAG: TROVE domain-containing protein [Armatimonadota bacterium]|nr:TROVE domain-containing protein [Armatimonadota bacterium]